MKNIENYIYGILLCLSLFLSSCQSEKTGKIGQKDWLINNESYLAQVIPSEDGKEITISNGLIERKFRISPNFATIGLKHLISQENFLRSVRPEAQVMLNGEYYDVGGLIGQPIHNYLSKSWTDSLANNESSFQFEKYSIENIKPRLNWKIREEWLPKDVKWPAPGKELIVEFKAPVRLSDSTKLEVLFDDNFSDLNNKWRIFSSKEMERNSFINEGKPGEIMAGVNNVVYAEMDFPDEATVVQCKIDPGTDQSASWGPGLALVFKEKTIKINLRPGNETFGIWDGQQELERGTLKEGKAYFLRQNLYGHQVVCEYSEDGENWNELAKITNSEKPEAIRLGKMDHAGGKMDGQAAGELGRSKIQNFSIFGRPISDHMEPYSLQGIKLKVHYEIYDGIPLISKWISVENHSEKTVFLDNFVSEILAAVEGESSVEGESDWRLPNMHVETDFAFSSMSNRKANHSTVHWKPDSIYTSQVNYALETPCLLEIHPAIGPAKSIERGGTFESFRAWELFFDSHDKERKGLSTRKMYRTIAPWVTENPILMHVRNADVESVKLAIDQAAEVGFDMVIMTFGSGFNMESGDPKYYREIKNLADYAHRKGIALGGYSLLASRSISEEDDVINPVTGRPGGTAYFGNSPCLASSWGLEYFRKIKEMYQQTGLDIIEHDGSYPGDICGSHDHPGHKGLADSQWNQFKIISDFYKWCRSEGIYLNVPDWYYLNGSSKCAMGYREVNWSLPRAQQEIIERQNIFDGTWTKTPSMGWMFVPLTEYHGGGSAATIEPLKDHLDHYSQRMANLFGAGVQACFRGPRLFDTDGTKAMVKGWVDFYHQHREVLNADIVHLRRPDGNDWDGILHVNPDGKEKGLLMVYNPLQTEISREITVPVYYTGLMDEVHLKNQDGISSTLQVDRNYNISMKITIPPKGHQHYVLN
ncbi:MAG: hypothetical protein WD431_22680 [Cyclobacteriaceae bacterium]